MSGLVLWAVAALLLALVLAGLRAVLVAPRALRLTTVDAPVPGLPAAFDGYTIAALSDLHHGARESLAHVRRAVALANGARPDLVVLLGDYGISFRRHRALSRVLYAGALPRLGSVLAGLRARDGLVGVLGNHDHYADPAPVREWLRALGARVLVNECLTIERDGARLVIGGVDDAAEGRVDPRAGCGPDERPHVVLSHHPDGVRALAADLGRPLVLAGHTHGGQIVLPLWGAPVTMSRVCRRRTARGWVPHARARLLVSSGVGVQIPVRFNCPPEVLVVRLRRAAAEAETPPDADDAPAGAAAQQPV